MACTKTYFLKMLDTWKKKHWTIFASDKDKRFWCNFEGQYKITQIIDTESKEPNGRSKIIYIGGEKEKAYNVWNN